MGKPERLCSMDILEMYFDCNSKVGLNKGCSNCISNVHLVSLELNHFGSSPTSINPNTRVVSPTAIGG